jgi:hypothetical protein
MIPQGGEQKEDLLGGEERKGLTNLLYKMKGIVLKYLMDILTQPSKWGR